jgi:hypothetical protein
MNTIEDGNRRIYKYLSKLAAQRREEEAKRPLRDWKSEALERKEQERRHNLISEKGLKAGQSVLLTHIDMKGIITEITEGLTRLPVYVKREDGEIFPYSPDDIEILSEKNDRIR